MNLFTLEDSRPLHFVGLGGAGMGALALLAMRRGVAVTGCDSNSVGTDDIVRAGAEMLGGHDPSHVVGARAVIHTAAVSSDHPEIVAARKVGIPVLKRAEALQATIEGGTVVAVAGTHGKTTTTVMVTDALTAARRDPTGIAGGRVASWDGNARLGSDLYVVEADEYDKSFLALYPTIAVINNVEQDHLECYGTVEELESSFVEFGSRAQRVLVNADDAGAMRVARRLKNPVWKIGTSKGADIRIADIVRTTRSSRARLEFPEGNSCRFEIGVPGLHNLRNASMALGAVAALGGDLDASAAQLKNFEGVGRRFELIGDAAGVTIVDDYAHHPTEVVVTIAAARQRFPDSRLIVAFQPHLFSRTRNHGEAMGVALSSADLAVVTDIYPAREEPIPGITGRLVTGAAEMAGGEVRWVPDVKNVARELAAVSKKGDVVVTMGAGDITDVSRELLEILRG